jgi:hypothetical protein
MTNPGGPIMPADTTAFALGGGGAHGDFEVGAVQYFYQWGLRPDIICGTSVGALNGIKLAEGESGPGSGLAGLTAIWNSLQVNSDMWVPAPWQATIKTAALLKYMQQPPEPPGITQVPIIGDLYSLVVGLQTLLQLPGDIQQLVADVETALASPSIALLDPIVTKLRQNVTRPLTIKLFMAVVSLEAGELRYVNEQGQLLDRNLQPGHIGVFLTVPHTLMPLTTSSQKLPPTKRCSIKQRGLGKQACCF